MNESTTQPDRPKWVDEMLQAHPEDAELRAWVERSESILTTLATDLGCPDWCDQPAGHAFETQTLGGFVRDHTVRGVAQVVSRGEWPLTAVLDIAEPEHVETVGRPGFVRTELPGIHLYGWAEGDPVSADDARRLAAALTAAAGRLDEILLGELEALGGEQ